MTYRFFIKNTFWTLEYQEDTLCRPQSAPPRLGSAAVVAPSPNLQPKLSPRRGRNAAARQKKRERRAEDEEVLEEFMATARSERWAHLACRLLAGAARAQLDIAQQARAAQALPTAAQDVPQVRLALPQRLFYELAALVFETEADIIFLVRLGVLRLQAGVDEVQIWSATSTLEHPILRSLLLTGSSLLAMARDGCFQICVDGCRPLVLRYTDKLSISDVEVVLLLQGFPLRSYQLLHLRRPLRQTGLLDECGVGAGSCILLRQNGVVQI